MRHLAIVAVLALAAVSAFAAYSWEDGGTILGSYGNLVDPTNVSGPQTGQNGAAGTYTCPGPQHGDYYLHVAEEPHSGTPQAYVAWVIGLVDTNDYVTASFYGYDVTPGASPSLRIWGHCWPMRSPYELRHPASLLIQFVSTSLTRLPGFRACLRSSAEAFLTP